MRQRDFTGESMSDMNALMAPVGRAIHVSTQRCVTSSGCSFVVMGSSFVVSHRELRIPTEQPVLVIQKLAMP